MDKDGINQGEYTLPPVLIRYVYEPYLECFRQALVELKRGGFEPGAQQKRPGLLRTFKTMLVGMYQQRWRFNLRHCTTL